MSKFRQGNIKAAKLSNEDVLELRRKYIHENPPWTQGALSRHYGLSINTVGRIVRGESRQSVPMAISSEDIAESAARLVGMRVDRVAERVDQELIKGSRPDRLLDELNDFDKASEFGVTEDRK